MPRGHDYAVIADTPNARVQIYARLGVVSIVVSTLLHDVAKQASHALAVRLAVPENRMVWVSSLITSASSIVIFGLLLYCFRRVGWRMWLGAPLHWFTGAVRQPDLSGTYQASILINGPIEDGPSRRLSKAIVDIVQDWDKMMVRFDVIEDSHTPWVRSTSDMAIMRIGLDPARVTLHYTYQYESAIRSADGSRGAIQTIRGACVMMFVRDKKSWRGSGHYYTEDSGSGSVNMSTTVAAGQASPTPTVSSTPGWRRRRLWGLRALPYGRTARGRSQPGPHEQG